MEYILEQKFSLEHSAKSSNSRTCVPAGFLSVCGLPGELKPEWSQGWGTQILGLLLWVLQVAVTYLRILK